MILQEVIPNPAHSVPRAEKSLIPAVSELSGLEKLIREGRALLAKVKDTEGRPLTARDVGSGVRRQFTRINRHREAAFL